LCLLIAEVQQQEEFYKKYKNELLKKYNLTQEQLSSIAVEAMEKERAFPKDKR